MHRQLHAAHARAASGRAPSVDPTRTTTSGTIATRSHLVRLAVACALTTATALTLASCSSSSPTIAGVWSPSDGTATKTISDDGTCTNMLYRGSTMYRSEDPAMCHITGTASKGDGYTLEVKQDPYETSYEARFSQGDDTMTLSRDGKTVVTLTKTK